MGGCYPTPGRPPVGHPGRNIVQSMPVEVIGVVAQAWCTDVRHNYSDR